MAYIADLGYPVPRVREATSGGEDVPPRTDLVMQRLNGPTMLHALEHGTITVEEAAAALADLLRRLHSIPARTSGHPDDRVLHLDLHPDNVILTVDGPIVIDWRNSEEGSPELDWAMSSLILAQVAVAGSAHAATARALLSSLLAHLPPAMALGVADSGPLPTPERDEHPIRP